MSLRHWPDAAAIPLGFLDGAGKWLSEHSWVGWAAVGISVAMILGAIGLLPWIVGRLPPDYFSHRRPPELKWRQMHPGLRIVVVAAKNLAGGLLIVAGFIMLFVPGQGILCMLLGLALVDVPGKRALERWIVARPPVFKAINKFRKRHGHPPLEHPYSQRPGHTSH